MYIQNFLKQKKAGLVVPDDSQITTTLFSKQLQVFILQTIISNQ